MPGMYLTNNYERFSLTDVGKFERRLIMWTKEACLHGKSMLIFDRDSLRVGGEPTHVVEENQSFYRVVLPSISFEYICITDSMCIMRKIWENKTQSVLYNMPKKWDGSELWHAF